MYIIAILGATTLLFSIWIIQGELRFNKVIKKDDGNNVKSFLGESIIKFINKAHTELLAMSGPTCINILERNANLVKKALLSNPELKMKIITRSDSDFENSNELSEIFKLPEIEKRVEIFRLKEGIIPTQHFVLIDKKHLLVSNVDKKGEPLIAFSMFRNKAKAKQFRDQFSRLHKTLDLVKLEF
ncbi:hypothetical protein ISS37_07180 [candidate division KSB1 bacterium]|nr:hypothetical protein [candidate division KSB1 bacterium]